LVVTLGEGVRDGDEAHGGDARRHLQAVATGWVSVEHLKKWTRVGLADGPAGGYRREHGGSNQPWRPEGVS
jgi:hypothetical protein